MFSGKSFEIQHGKINAEKQFTAEGEEEAYRMETNSIRAGAKLAGEVIAKAHQKYIDEGKMYRCDCGGAFYEYERAKHNRMFHNQRKKR
tara:strand:+ start:580 stop:846 length:267 start_codon:yes stop_codon:yes gene_type:complete